MFKKHWKRKMLGRMSLKKMDQYHKLNFFPKELNSRENQPILMINVWKLLLLLSILQISLKLVYQ